jgi:pyrroline-5-carboxylate reductase
MQKIAIIGGGNLGQALATGLCKQGLYTPEQITITRRNIQHLQSIAALGVHVMTDNKEAVKGADIIILAVKPFQLSSVLQELSAYITDNQLVISVVTGVELADIRQTLDHKGVVVRAMPNTAIAIQESMTCLSADVIDIRYQQMVSHLFGGLGKTVWIDEHLMDAATVLGACGTAFALRYIRANIQGGIEIGFDAQTASLIAAQTIKGAAELLLVFGSHPEQEIDKVTTPKGCTIAGLNEMEHQGFSSSLIRGLVASFRKIQGLG